MRSVHCRDSAATGMTIPAAGIRMMGQYPLAHGTHGPPDGTVSPDGSCTGQTPHARSAGSRYAPVPRRAHQLSRCRRTVHPCVDLAGSISPQRSVPVVTVPLRQRPTMAASQHATASGKEVQSAWQRHRSRGLLTVAGRQRAQRVKGQTQTIGQLVRVLDVDERKVTRTGRRMLGLTATMVCKGDVPDAVELELM